MATKASVRDTGIVALVPCELPRPRKGGARVGGITLTAGSVAIHAGETEHDATAFAAAMRASYARYIEAHPPRDASGQDETITGPKARKAAAERASAYADVRRLVSKPSDGLVPHACAEDGETRKVRGKYVNGRYCPACDPLAVPVKRDTSSRGQCADCSLAVWHTEAYAGHPWRAIPMTYETPALAMLDVPRPALPPDLYEPIAWRKVAPRPAPVARPVKAAAVRKAPRKARAPRKIESRPEPRMVAPAPVASPRKPERGYRPAPCSRCGRNDFSTDKGRAWHLANNPSCANRRKPERHSYIAA